MIKVETNSFEEMLLATITNFNSAWEVNQAENVCLAHGHQVFFQGRTGLRGPSLNL